MSGSYRRLGPNDWWYEERDCLRLRHEIFDMENKLIRNDEIRLSWKKLEGAVARHRARMRRLPKRAHAFETAAEIEIQIARYFGVRSHIIVPNVSWGLLAYEADLIVMHKSLYADEVEIKVTAWDMKADGKKYHRHDDDRIRRLWFAIPKKLERHADRIPEAAGILTVNSEGRVRELRPAQINRQATKFSEAGAQQLARLGALRIWDLKYKILHPKQRGENGNDLHEE
jgi:hypothetical protein